MIQAEKVGVSPRNQNLQDQIREILEAEILAGIRLPGSAINEKQLALAFNASRTPVREALIVLAAQGLVTIVPRSGIYVRKANMADLLSALEALAELEAVVAGFAAMRATKNQINIMVKSLEAGEIAARSNDIDAYRDANTRLHVAIHKAGMNPVLAEQIRHVRHLLMGYRHRSFEMSGRLQISIQEHVSIVQAIRHGDVEQAKSAMKNHIQHGAQAMVTLLRMSGESESM